MDIRKTSGIIAGIIVGLGLVVCFLGIQLLVKKAIVFLDAYLHDYFLGKIILLVVHSLNGFFIIGILFMAFYNIQKSPQLPKKIVHTTFALGNIISVWIIWIY